jgi:YHS domain-containing protein
MEHAKAPLRTVKVRARGEDFRVVQLVGHLLVCSKEHGNCCCGWEEKGRLRVNLDLYQEEWERRKIRNQIHLTFTACLGPCAVGNSALLLIAGRSIWLKDLNDDALIPRMFDYIEAILRAGQVIPPPDDLAGHLYERFLPPPPGDYLPLVASEEQDDGGIERLDPVCLMDVDPATARWKSEYGGRTYYFCAPSCKKAFDRSPAEYA